MSSVKNDEWDFEVSLSTKKKQLQEKQQQLNNLRDAVATTQREIDILTGMIRGMEEVGNNVEIETDGK